METKLITMAICVVEKEGEEVVELPLEKDGSLSLLSLQSQFYGACGLKYRNPENNVFRGVRYSKNKLNPFDPDQGWGDHIYICVFPKENKQKSYDRLLNSSSKTKKLENNMKSTTKSNFSNYNDGCSGNLVIFNYGGGGSCELHSSQSNSAPKNSQHQKSNNIDNTSNLKAIALKLNNSESSTGRLLKHKTSLVHSSSSGSTPKYLSSARGSLSTNKYIHHPPKTLASTTKNNKYPSTAKCPPLYPDPDSSSGSSSFKIEPSTSFNNIFAIKYLPGSQEKPSNSTSSIKPAFKIKLDELQTKLNGPSRKYIKTLIKEDHRHSIASISEIKPYKDTSGRGTAYVGFKSTVDPKEVLKNFKNTTVRATIIKKS